ncbi:MAG: DUF2149 domain-containing protein [Anaerovorax sp.]|nr:DUF2149 domain-containing protein [Anaerovorax sp.]
MLDRRARRSRLSEEEVDPIAGLANLVDVMLVFSCGLLVALVMTWNLQDILFQKVDVEKGQQLVEVPKIEQSGGEGYSEMGKVYEDPETGKLILIEEVPLGSNQ